jgi:phosphomannomutase/phosphoglucomutase
MTDHIFREYDIRGVAERDLTNEQVFRIGWALASLLAPESGDAPRLVVARDCRLSGPRLHEWLLRGLVAGGAHVTDVGVGPTPLMYFGVHHLGADGGVMITGSHNPAEDNGFKIMKGKASFFGADIQRLREKTKSAPHTGSEGVGRVQELSIYDHYLEAVTSRVAFPRGVGQRRVVVDAGNGAAGPLGLQALRRVGIEPVALYCDMDGRFPNHHPDPTVPKNLTALVQAVKEHDAVVGIAWDGDGDRIGVVDASGEIVWGDRLLALVARRILRDHPGATVLGDVKCSQVLFDDVSQHGGRPIMYKTGHSLIKTKMKEEKALAAGEMSGHFFFADRYFGYDDAIYAALRVLEILAEEQKTVLELLADLPRTHSTPEIRMDCPDALKFDVVQAVHGKLSASDPAGGERGRLSTIDGVRVTYDDGAWGLVRASNTGPVIVLRFEAPTEARLAEVRSRVEGVVLATRTELGG